ncbi:MAG: ABC transporter ATP-binding protein, partial [Roseburia sp.]|nr:ABC transporter ATP-binding protein [Roseburia sp.]
MNQMKKAFEVFDSRQKRKLAYLTFIIFIDAFVELLGVSVIIPFIQAVTTPEVLLENKYARWAYDFLGMKDTNQFIILMAALIIAVYIFKNIFLVYMYNLQYKFSYYGKKQMQNTLMRYYIGQ